MTRGVVTAGLVVAAVLVLAHAAFAQEGQITGSVRDTSEAVMPGVTVEVTSPALIECVGNTWPSASCSSIVRAPWSTPTLPAAIEAA